MGPGEELWCCVLGQLTPSAPWTMHVPRRTASHTPAVNPTNMKPIYVAKKQLDQPSLSLFTVHQGCACR